MNSIHTTTTQEAGPQFGFMELTVLVLSIYVLGALAMQTAFQLPPSIDKLLNHIDFLVCIIFLSDFCIRFHRAPSKLSFLKWGWIDLISSIPAVDFLRWGRLVRVIRIIRVLRAFRSTKHLLAFLYRNRVKSLIGTAAISAVVLVIFSCIAILAFETDQDSNIKTPFDAMWWALSTITTVGYGDKCPLTVEGKLVAVILMVTGVGLFGVLTGLFARLLVEPELKKDEADIRQLAEEIRLLRQKLDEVQMDDRKHPHKSTSVTK